MNQLSRLRLARGLTQTALAERAGVSRQLVGAVEAGRHMPRVDAAIALAGALGVAVDHLFGRSPVTVDVLTGMPAPDGALVRLGRVGDRPVAAPLRRGEGGWDVADGMVDDLETTAYRPMAPGLVVAGCEPALELLERLLRQLGSGAVSVPASSATAVRALDEGRAHAAVTHAAIGEEGSTPPDVERFELARWRVGLAAPPDSSRAWWKRALSGEVPVIQREAGAAAQRAFEEAVPGSALPVPGPLVSGHLQAASRAVLTGLPAVTIEPAALAFGAVFHPIETHRAELWVGREWAGERLVAEAMEVIAGPGFQRRLEAIGGYDLSGSGSRVA